jgi:eukaryotic-like serine/threonine-protein kinase
VGKHFIVIAGLDKGRILPMAENDLVQIGRSKSVTIETRLRDPSIARVHCEVEVQEGRVVLCDVDSPTGTFVNGQRVQRHELQHNDVVQIGDVQMRYLDEGALPRSVASLTLPDVGADTHHPPAASAPAPAPAAPPASAFSLNLPPGADALKGLTGKTLGAYLVGQIEGTGFCGRVFRARDTRSNRIVALKVIRPDLFAKAEDILRFADVLKPVLPLRHPHLVASLGAGKSGPYCWLALEFLPGKSALQLIRRTQTTGLLPWQTALRVAVQVAQALVFAARHGFYHGNLTPQDVLLCGKNLDAKLNDLMLAQALRLPPASVLPGPGNQLEDLACLAPERTQWGFEVDGRADVYSLGATVYGLLTGQMPFTGETQLELFDRIREAPPVRPKRLQPEVPERFEAVVLRMLAKRPEDRYQTPAELLAVLEKMAGDQQAKA